MQHTVKKVFLQRDKLTKKMRIQQAIFLSTYQSLTARLIDKLTEHKSTNLERIQKKAEM